ncbi:MAG TPA: FKBP-type peptidyl-prolyl cis-trans isomerase [Longimicrobiaceae bacterium]|nr:FKBP-type peptidyl-prolyl cis-trans isomerase [Longimicrobiaceae bacterium]
MTRKILVAAAATITMAACLDTDPVQPTCQPITLEIASTQGDTVTTQTGLRYIETSVGTGAEVESCVPIEITYEGRLTDGTLFDSGGFPFTPGLTRLIPGFEQGVIGIRAGGSRRLIVPPSLGYGSQPQTDRAGNVIIPANSTLIFDVEVVSVGN